MWLLCTASCGTLPPPSLSAPDGGGQSGRTLCHRTCPLLPGILHGRPQEKDEGRVSGMGESMDANFDIGRDVAGLWGVCRGVVGQ